MPAYILSIVLVLVGQLFNAFIVLVDKHIVTQTAVKRPVVYAFYVGIISGVVMFLLPFGVVNIPSFEILALSALIGIVFIISIILLFSALKSANATDVVAWLAAISTLTTFIGGYFFLDEDLPASFPYALILFLVGMILVGHFRFYARSFTLVIFSGILFGFSAILIKVLFGHTTFVDAFFWSRMGNVLAALLLLLSPSVRSAIFTTSKEVTHKTSSLIFLNRALGGLAFLCILYAIRLGTVSIVNALSAFQFVFVFILVLLFSKRLPHLYEHEFRPGHRLHKLAAMFFIVTGFFVLFI